MTAGNVMSSRASPFAILVRTFVELYSCRKKKQTLSKKNSDKLQQRFMLTMTVRTTTTATAPHLHAILLVQIRYFHDLSASLSARRNHHVMLGNIARKKSEKIRTTTTKAHAPVKFNNKPFIFVHKGRYLQLP